MAVFLKNEGKSSNELKVSKITLAIRQSRVEKCGVAQSQIYAFALSRLTKGIGNICYPSIINSIKLIFNVVRESDYFTRSVFGFSIFFCLC